jgi:hypothetical protein
MTWLNSDGLFVKFGKEEGATNRGGAISKSDKNMIEFYIEYTDALSATPAILANSGGSQGVIVPKNVTIEAVETLVVTPFTSSGTIGTATLVIGLDRSTDRSTDLDADAFTTTAFVGSLFDAAGERQYLVPGSTGAGSAIGGTITTYNGVVVVSNSQHASHPFTAGKLKVRVFYFTPD